MTYNKLNKIIKGYHKILREEDKPNNALQWVITPESIIDEMFHRIGLDMSNKKVCVLFNPDIVFYLLQSGVDAANIWFVSDALVKTKFVVNVGVPAINILEKNANNIINIIDKDKKVVYLMFENNPKIDVWITNPPYTDGSTGRAAIYHYILDAIVAKKPEAIGVICPASLFKSGVYKNTKNNIIKTYSVPYIRYLSSEDWEEQKIDIPTISFVAKPQDSESINTRVIASSGNTFDVNLSLIPALVDFADDRLAKLIYSIQTVKKWEFIRPSGGIVAGRGVTTISKKTQTYECNDSENVIANTIPKYKVTIGWYRFRTVVIIPDGVGFTTNPPAFAYIPCDTLDEATKLKNYLTSTFIMLVGRYSRNSVTASNPQFSLIPWVDLTQFSIVNDEVINDYFGIKKIRNHATSDSKEMNDEEIKKIKIENELVQYINEERRKINNDNCPY